ncbi:YeeE/YedE family protein [Sulfurimonas sp. C5]|uniref:YeeE/YedE family protein n=1 Tax=Sulfurimonas sp. C5 TaxID=3036947 RepID=UPI00245729C1|nr:YeeE/YedE family protein [Sulfurimonas sp. C5]MDH4943690.1 YeeE/YedE family protein [Sulfurimonas sp. C5]
MENYIEDLNIINICAFTLGLMYGLVAQYTQFCFSGAIKDYIQIKSTRRASSILVAIITAVILSQSISIFFQIDFYKTIYFKDEINYLAIVIGGIVFGIGMMLADGCSSRQLIKLSQGNIYSLVTILFIAIFAYITSKGLFSYLINLLNHNELLLKLSSYLPNMQLSILLVLPVLLFLLWKMVPNIKSLLLCFDGLIIGVLISLAWFVTGVINVNEFEISTLEGLSFVYPSGKALEYLMFFSGTTLSFGVSVILGLLAGGTIMALFNKKYRVSCAPNDKENKLKNSIIGGSMMGIGGILTLGCTVGQGLTGVSTLALASFIAISSIALSAYFTAIYLHKRNALPSCYLFEWNQK